MHSPEPAPPFSLQLAIQGGGAKICALLAAMEAIQTLQSEGIVKVTRIAGTSAGAIVGCLFAAGIDMALVRERLRNVTPTQLARLFPAPGLNVVTRLSRGRPLWNDDFLRSELARFLELEAKVYTFEDLTNKKQIKVFVVAANLTDSVKVVHGLVPTENVVESLLDSCGLPFCFRIWSKAGSRVIVDGGICENLPSDELEDETKDGPIIGVSFYPVRGRSPITLKNFSIALLDTAMNNSMTRAKVRLGERVFSISTDIGTFDFARALNEGLGDKYELVKVAADKFFREFVSAQRNKKVTVSPAAWEEQNTLMMSTLGEVYKKQHEPTKLRYKHCSLFVEANSLSGDLSQEDYVNYGMTFETLDDPIYCHAVSLSETEHQAIFGQSELSVLDEAGRAVEIRKVPIRDPTTTTGTRLLLFFLPALRPNSGTYTLEVKDAVRDVAGRLREGRWDELSFMPLRASGTIDKVDLVLHWPKASGDVRMVPKAGKFQGRQMTPLELGNYPYRTGYRALGWTGEGVPSDREFGVDLFHTKQ